MKNLQSLSKTVQYLIAFCAVLFGSISGNVILAGEIGAKIPWTTYEAETSSTNGVVQSGFSKRDMVKYEASGRSAVELKSPESFVSIKSTGKANRITVRYSIPRGRKGTIGLYTNTKLKQEVPLTSYRIWNKKNNLPGGFCRFFDEVIIEAKIKSGDEIKFVKWAPDSIASCMVDFIDLEQIADPLSKPEHMRNGK